TDPTGEFVFNTERGDFDFTSKAEIERKLEELKRANAEKEKLVAFEQKLTAFDAITRRVDALVKVPQSLAVAGGSTSFAVDRSRLTSNQVNVRQGGVGNSLRLQDLRQSIDQSRRRFATFGGNSPINNNPVS